MISRRNFMTGLAVAGTLPLSSRLAASAPAAATAGDGAVSLRVVSANIRVALAEDEEKGVGWSQRRDLCLDILEEQSADIVCLQEVLWIQAVDLRKRFSDHTLFGFEGPEMDGRYEGYHGIAKNPILFSNRRFEWIAAGTQWLSETPHLAGSESWGTARARHVNWVRLRDRQTDRQFRVLNTHLDHRSQPAREGQIGTLLGEAAAYAEDFPQVLAGDFNARINNRVIEMVREAGWSCTYEAVHGPGDPGFTTHRFMGEGYPEWLAPRKPPGRIDFIWSRGPIRSVASHIIRDHRDGRYPSDHYFLAADLRIGS